MNVKVELLQLFTILSKILIKLIVKSGRSEEATILLNFCIMGQFMFKLKGKDRQLLGERRMK